MPYVYVSDIFDFLLLPIEEQKKNPLVQRISESLLNVGISVSLQSYLEYKI